MSWMYAAYSFALLPLLGLAYVGLALWGTYAIAKRLKSPLSKMAVVLVVPAVFIVIPAADEIAGQLQFAKLCEARAGTKVLRSVVIDDAHFAQDGSPKMDRVRGQSTYMVAGRYTVTSTTEDVRAWPRISIYRTEVRDREGADLLAERVNFHYWGGWLVQRLPGHQSARTCPNARDDQVPFLSKVFLRNRTS